MWVAADTHVGQKRDENQDAYIVSKTTDGVFVVVCDGMGGVRGGQMASRLAADTMSEQVLRSLKADMGEVSIRRVLESATAASNEAVRHAVKKDASLEGMGTTLIAVVATAKAAHIAHAGDSRAYLLRDDLLTQLTVDHTVVQMLIDRGDITRQDAKTHPHRHYITRAVGVGDNLRFDIFSIDLREGDAILVCTDGLYNYVGHENLCALTAVGLCQESVSPLINSANQNGGGDNITAALIGLTEGS
jgi:protein phosphatase